MRVSSRVVSLCLLLLVACGADRGDSVATSGGDGLTAGVGTDGTGADDDSGGLKLDVSDDTAGGQGCGEGGAGGVWGDEFSYIWIANSAEATVSKIDTRAGVELARYRTGPGTENPSRTSVNLNGDVAVMNRQGSNGSVVKIAAREADCDGPSSSGPDDVKPWGQDGCVLWSSELPSGGIYENGPRPVAWEPTPEEGCNANPRLWVGWGDMNAAVGHFRRLDGKTGETLDEVSIPNWETSVAPIGPYGGAVNAAGDLWAVGLGGPLIRIDGVTLEVEYHPRPAASYFYGIWLDAFGNPWMGDLSGITWTYFPETGLMRKNPQAGARGRGIAVDREFRVWTPVHANPNPVAGQCSLAEVDGKSGDVLAVHALDGCVEPVGVATDADGFVWVVDKGANRAYKFDPDTKTVALSVGGLNGPYTYSDMTGSGLDLVTHPPAG